MISFALGKIQALYMRTVVFIENAEKNLRQRMVGIDGRKRPTEKDFHPCILLLRVGHRDDKQSRAILRDPHKSDSTIPRHARSIARVRRRFRFHARTYPGLRRLPRPTRKRSWTSLRVAFHVRVRRSSSGCHGNVETHNSHFLSFAWKTRE